MRLSPEALLLRGMLACAAAVCAGAQTNSGQISARAAPRPPLAVLPINDGSIAQIRKGHPLASAEVDDPVYLRKERYQGFWLSDVLKDLSRGRSAGDLYVRFRCKDGYLPVMPLARALAGKGLIAVRDAQAPQGEDWQKLPASAGGATTPAPSYVVWVSPAGDTDTYPWPYQVVAIELVQAADALGGLDTGEAKPGRELFITHCLKCHAINGVGGTLGPELNSPCSVTEYWNPRLLSRFIADAASVRAATRMPNFKSVLTEKDVELLVEYLHSMAGHKEGGAKCP